MSWKLSGCRKNRIHQQQFPMLEFDQWTTQIKEVNAIDKRLEMHNKNIPEK